MVCLQKSVYTYIHNNGPLPINNYSSLNISAILTNIFFWLVACSKHLQMKQGYAGQWIIAEN